MVLLCAFVFEYDALDNSAARVQCDVSRPPSAGRNITFVVYITVQHN